MIRQEREREIDHKLFFICMILIDIAYFNCLLIPRTIFFVRHINLQKAKGYRMRTAAIYTYNKILRLDSCLLL